MNRLVILMLVVPVLLAVTVRDAMAEATINLIITDAPDTGFFDPTPRSPGVEQSRHHSGRAAT